MLTKAECHAIAAKLPDDPLPEVIAAGLHAALAERTCAKCKHANPPPDFSCAVLNDYTEGGSFLPPSSEFSCSMFTAKTDAPQRHGVTCPCELCSTGTVIKPEARR